MTTILIALVACYSVLTYSRNRVWKGEITLWSDIVTKSPNKARPHYNLGHALLDAGKTNDAIFHFEKALAIFPQYYLACNDLGNALFEKGEIEKVSEAYREAIRLPPYYVDAYNNLGIAFIKPAESKRPYKPSQKP